MQFNKAVISMSRQFDESPCEDEVMQLRNRLDSLPQHQRGQQALCVAADLLEIAAFDLAQTIPAKDAGALIEAAALLAERLASTDVPSMELVKRAEDKIQ